MIIFANGPAGNAFNSGRDALYNWGYTPTFQTDGILQRIGWSQSIVQGHIDTRLAVPSYLDISVDIFGNASGGIAVYTLIAEQDLGVSPLKLYSAIVESGDIASSAYGYYAGQVMAWEPRAWPAGATGTSISFTGPYPETIIIEKPYTLDPSQHSFDMLDVVSFVQLTTGNHEVMNAHFMDLPDTDPSGIHEGSTEAVNSISIGISNNPSNGSFNINTIVPSGVTGTIAIYDLYGRIAREFEAGGITPVVLEETGVYFIHLLTSTGETVIEKCTVIR
ncbi:MAG: T9SS type A sorting domain-containing protein [Candidatus Aegiribacteria sp.]|nr:T9SS type A sorting domain-containing protein [Candidatus Aegiribacteria sp.]